MKFSRNKLKYSVNETFFDTWTPHMAYILGFTFADGNIYKNTLAWDIQKRDLNLLKKIKKALNATYQIRIHRNHSYRLRIHNQILIAGAINKGLLPKKNIRNTIPNIPNNLLKHFIRGYLDGDGWIVIRNKRTNYSEIDAGFSSGNKQFLDTLSLLIGNNLNIDPPNVRKKIKATDRNITSTTYMFELYSKSAFQLINWLYGNLEKNDLYLNRKYRKYLQAQKINNYLQSGTKVLRVVQKRLGKPMKEILNNLYNDKKLDGVQISKILKVHSSSIYRWLAKTGVKHPERRAIYG